MIINFQGLNTGSDIDPQASNSLHDDADIFYKYHQKSQNIPRDSRKILTHLSIALYNIIYTSGSATTKLY